MPELPEVETMRRGVLPIVGSRISDVRFIKSSLKRIRITPRRDAFQRRVRNQEIVDVRRIGKRVVVVLGNEHFVVLEPRMTGLVLLSDPPSQQHLRAGFRLSGGTVSWLWYWDRRGLGSVRLLSSEQLREELGPSRLGPDALSITLRELRDRLGASRRAIKVALLDQQAIAGIGNLYASEILHVAQVHPAKICRRISSAQWSKLHLATQTVLREAIRFEGSTLSDGTYRNALNQQGRYQNHHRVYGRADQPCPRCDKAHIKRVVQAQRSTFFCPVCQVRR